MKPEETNLEKQNILQRKKKSESLVSLLVLTLESLDRKQRVTL